MSQDQNQIKAGLATEEQVNQEFIDAWHRAEQGTLTTTEERLYFLDTKTFLEILSQDRLMRTIKEEEVDLSDYQNYAEAYQQIQQFLEDVYMRKRIHSALGYLTPVEFEAQFYADVPDAAEHVH